MSFESRIVAFSERFLSDRAFLLIVTPALADLEFDPGTGRRTRVARRFSVIRAVAGGLGDDLKRDVGSFVALTLMPVCYYIFLMVVCFDFFSISTGFFAVATMILVLSLCPVMVCFWPERRNVRPIA